MELFVYCANCGQAQTFTAPSVSALLLVIDKSGWITYCDREGVYPPGHAEGECPTCRGEWRVKQPVPSGCIAG